MKLITAGLLMYRRGDSGIEYLLVHHGTPFFKNKNVGGWTIPKGQANPGEDLLIAAEREFTEETGSAPRPPYIDLGNVEQRNNKIVHAWAFEGDLDVTKIKSNMGVTEWPPRSGKLQSFPEIDKGEFFSAADARNKLGNAQIAFVERLEQILNAPTAPAQNTPTQ
jgi:predicted NUDIX family NTP pyrophosphohydrolase